MQLGHSLHICHFIFRPFFHLKISQKEMKKILLGMIALGGMHIAGAQTKTYDLYVVAEGNFGTPNGDVFHAARIHDTTHTFSGGLFQTANGTQGIDVLQDYGTFGDKAILCSKGANSSPYRLAIVSYPSFDTIKTFQSGGGVQCLGKASNTKAYISMATGNSIQMIDLINNTLTPVTNTNSQISSYASFMEQANGSEYVAIGSKIVKIDTATNTTTTSILPNIGTIVGMQYDKATNFIWLLGKVSGTSALVKIQPDSSDLVSAPIILTGVTTATLLRLALNKLYFISLSTKNVYAYNIANPNIPTPVLYTSTLPGNSYSFAYGKSFDVDPRTGDFALSTAGNYAQPTQYEIVDGTTFQRIDTGSVAGRIANELELHTYFQPVIDTTQLADVFQQCSATLTAPSAVAGYDTVYATTSDSTHYAAQGSYNVTWTYTNGYNVVTKTQHVIIEDSIAPVPDTATLATLNVSCPYTLVPPTAFDNCSGAVTGTTDSLTFTTAGSYTITWSYADANGNVAHQTQQITVSCATAINNVNGAVPSLNIYPNPANGKVTVSFDSYQKGDQLLIANTLGQVLLQQAITSKVNTIALDHLAKGIYYVRFLHNGVVYNKAQKLIVE
jgi:hypothetical protein